MQVSQSYKVRKYVLRLTYGSMSYMATNSVVTSKGQIVIPAEIRKKYGIKKGTQVAFIEDGPRLILAPVTDEFIDSLHGCLKNGPSILAYLRKERKRDWRP